ncbi:DUF6192 family protein [Streptomyces sp. NPDC055078]
MPSALRGTRVGSCEWTGCALIGGVPFPSAPSLPSPWCPGRPGRQEPPLKKIDRTAEFFDQVTALPSFVAAAGGTVPGLRDRTVSEDESAIVPGPQGRCC